jgi:hypothetical protein
MDKDDQLQKVKPTVDLVGNIFYADYACSPAISMMQCRLRLHLIQYDKPNGVRFGTFHKLPILRMDTIHSFIHSFIHSKLMEKTGR